MTRNIMASNDSCITSWPWYTSLLYYYHFRTTLANLCENSWWIALFCIFKKKNFWTAIIGNFYFNKNNSKMPQNYLFLGKSGKPLVCYNHYQILMCSPQWNSVWPQQKKTIFQEQSWQSAEFHAQSINE